MDQAAFITLLERSDAFQGCLVDALDMAYDKAELQPIWPLLVVVHEHAAGVRALIAQNMGNSALALMRVLFDAVVRQMWAGYCATPEQFEVLNSRMTMESLEVSKDFPMTKQMLKDLEKDGPPALHKLLNEFITYSWKPLNSVVHTGSHAIQIASEGLSVQLAGQMVKQANNLLHISGYQIALLTQSIDTHEAIVAMYSEFDDCLQSRV